MRRYSAGSLILLLLTVGTSIPEPSEAALITVDGVCTLNAAIVAANEDRPVGSCPAGSGPDTIELTQSVLLQVVDNSIDGPNGLPSVTSAITIEGNGFGVVRDRTMEPFRIFHIGGTGDLTLRSLQIVLGRADGEFGGGGIFARGRVHLVDCDLMLNDAIESGSSRGGGMYVVGEAVIERSVIAENEAEPASPDDEAIALGGGIYVAGFVAVRDSSVSDNWATVDESVATSLAGGGGIFVEDGGRLEARDSTFSDNVAEAKNAAGGGLAVVSTGFASIMRSTISGNLAVGFESGGGAGIFGQAEILNCTLSRNRVYPGTAESRGGGFAGNGYIMFTTFYGNEALEGAAVFGTSSSRVGLWNTLLARSVGDHCSGTVVDAGGNLADDGSCLPTIPGTLTGVDPILADNGGPTLTHELSPESTAIDIAGDCGLVTDQRGAARAGPCDSGAYEEIGCDLLEIDSMIIEVPWLVNTCSTAILGPDLVVDSPLFLVQAGHLITVRDGFEVLGDSGLVLALAGE